MLVDPYVVDQARWSPGRPERIMNEIKSFASRELNRLDTIAMFVST